MKDRESLQQELEDAERLKLMLRNKEREIQDMRNQIQEYEGALNEGKAIEQRLNTLRSDTDRLKRENEILKKAEKDAERLREQMKIERELNQKEVQSYKSRVSGFEDRLKMFDREKLVLEKQLEESNERLVSLQNQLEHSDDIIAELRNERDRLLNGESENQTLRFNLDRLNQKINDLQEQVLKEQEIAQLSKKAQEQAERDKLDAIDKIRELQKKLDLQSNQNARNQHLNDNLNLREENTNLKRDIQRLQTKLQNAHEHANALELRVNNSEHKSISPSRSPSRGKIIVTSTQEVIEGTSPMELQIIRELKIRNNELKREVESLKQRLILDHRIGPNQVERQRSLSKGSGNGNAIIVQTTHEITKTYPANSPQKFQRSLTSAYGSSAKKLNLAEDYASQEIQELQLLVHQLSFENQSMKGQLSKLKQDLLNHANGHYSSEGVNSTIPCKIIFPCLTELARPGVSKDLLLLQIANSIKLESEYSFGRTHQQNITPLKQLGPLSIHDHQNIYSNRSNHLKTVPENPMEFRSRTMTPNKGGQVYQPRYSSSGNTEAVLNQLRIEVEALKTKLRRKERDVGQS